MKYMKKILNEHINNIHLIFRIASFDIKSTYQLHYLGVFWQFLNPAIQILIYWFVFGLGIRGGSSIEGVPFIVWLILGLVPWFFIAPTIIQGSNSVFSKVGLVSKMNFPVSVLPSIVIVGNGVNFLFMLIIVEGIMLIYGVTPSIYLLQLPYYLLCLLVFTFAFTLFSSTLSTVVRDYQLFLQSMMRMLLYVSPILWDTSYLPGSLEKLLMLNPLFYIIDGIRMSFLSQAWFFQYPSYSLYFWTVTLLILFVGSYLHINFRDRFVDYI